MTMTREEFELEYANRHMKYDPRDINSKVKSVVRLRQDDGYNDTLIQLCWNIQRIKDVPSNSVKVSLLNKLRW